MTVQSAERSRGGSIQLHAIGVDFQLGGGREQRVLQDVNLDVASGEFVCFLGASGCGKTTLLNVAAGLIRATRGTVTINGKALDDAANRHQLAYVFQDHRLLPWRTAQANAEFGLEALGVPRDERRRRARAVLELVGLGAFAQSFPGQLSGGMRSRVALARALAIEPSVLLMDEPFGALDAQTRTTMQRELVRLWSETRRTVLFVTHDILEAIVLADRIVVLAPQSVGVAHIETVTLERPRELKDDGVLRLYARLAEFIEH